MIKNEVARAALEVTRKWAIDELEAARGRVTNLRCGGEAYNHAIEAIVELTRTIYHIGSMLDEIQPEELETFKEYCRRDVESTTTVAPVEPEPDPEPESEPTDDRPIPALEDVRGQCGEAKKKGADIKGILTDMGYKNLSSVDSKDYNALLDKVNAALAEL